MGLICDRKGKFDLFLKKKSLFQFLKDNIAGNKRCVKKYYEVMLSWFKNGGCRLDVIG
jgi:hypothetical protein